MAEILICMDNPKFLELLTHILLGEGYQVEVVKEPDKAVKKILGEEYKTFILSLPMKEGMGLKAIPIINKSDPTLPIIAITEDDSLEFQRRVRKEKIFYYFVKSFDPEEMKSVVKNAIDYRKRFVNGH